MRVYMSSMPTALLLKNLYGDLHLRWCTFLVLFVVYKVQFSMVLYLVAGPVIFY